jgi:hypothetical protein
MALIFSYKFEATIVNELNKANAKSSFFVNGLNWDCAYNYADELVAAYSAGHLIGKLYMLRQ